ncbi:amidohydrolase family protein [Chloroflexota bacterium]
MIIDARCRPPYKDYYPLLKSMYSSPLRRPAFPGIDPPSIVQGSMELFFHEMDEAGITKAVIVGRNRPNFVLSNDIIAELVREFPDRMIGVAGIDCYNEFHQAVPETERCIRELKLHGICVEPGGNRRFMHFHDSRLYPIYAKCSELKVPVFITTGPRQGTTLEYTSPVHVEQVANDFPDLKIVCAHACWPYAAEMIGVAYRCSNIYISPDIYVFWPGGELYVKSAELIIHDQLLFGTAYPFAPFKESVEAWEKFSLRKDILNKIFYENAARVFGL